MTIIKKSDLFVIAQVAVLRDESIEEVTKLHVIRELQNAESTAKWSEQQEEALK